MNLGDLMTELRENILHDRTDRISGSSDYLWSDATLVRYIHDAQVQLALRALVIRDATTPDVTRVTLRTGVVDYELHTSVLAVTSGRLAGDRGDLARTGHAMLNTYIPPDTMFFDPDSASALQPGKPVAFATDESVSESEGGGAGRVNMRVYPTPTAEYDGVVINLRVIRLPMHELRVADLCAELEVPQEHHLGILDWAAYLALRLDDIDAGSPKRALEFRQSFDLLVTEARRNAMRKMRAPPKFRFGGNGFSWE